MKNSLNIEQWMTQLVALMGDKQRVRLTRQIGTIMRKANQRRIRAQVSADGSAWEKRKTPTKHRRKMLTGFARAQHLKTVASTDGVEVGYRKSAARLAQIHHAGLLGSVSPGGPRVDYPERPLLGWAEIDIAEIDKLLMTTLRASTGA